jgi:hypothetical protein
MSPAADARISSIRATSRAAMRPSSSERLVLVVGRCPSISTLPAVAPKPRRSSPSSIVKPGSWRTMSNAVTGLKRAKKTGSKACRPSAGCADVCCGACALAASLSARMLTAAAATAFQSFTVVPSGTLLSMSQ